MTEASEPDFISRGRALSAIGELAGLGNGDVQVILTATGTPSATCTNQGGSQAPGQSPAEVTLTGEQSIPATRIQNGNVMFNVLAETCTAEITDVEFTGATLTVVQDGVVVLTKTYSL